MDDDMTEAEKQARIDEKANLFVQGVWIVLAIAASMFVLWLLTHPDDQGDPGDCIPSAGAPC